MKTGRPPKLTNELVEAIKEYYLSGATLTTTAKEFHLSLATISKALKMAGLDAGINGENASIHAEEALKNLDPSLENSIIRDFKAGNTFRQIQLEYHVNPIILNQILVKNGLRQVTATPIPKKVQPVNYNLSEGTQIEIVNNYLQGTPRNVLAAQYKISSEMISTILRNYGITSLRTSVTPELEERLCSEYKLGFMTPYDIGKIYDLPPTLVRYYLGKNGLTKTDEHGKIIVGVSPSQVKKIARDASEDIIQALIELALNPEISTKDRLYAASMVLDRGLGRVADPKPEDEEKAKGSVLSLLGGDKMNKLKGGSN